MSAWSSLDLVAHSHHDNDNPLILLQSGVTHSKLSEQYKFSCKQLHNTTWLSDVERQISDLFPSFWLVTACKETSARWQPPVEMYNVINVMIMNMVSAKHQSVVSNCVLFLFL